MRLRRYRIKARWMKRWGRHLDRDFFRRSLLAIQQTYRDDPPRGMEVQENPNGTWTVSLTYASDLANIGPDKMIVHAPYHEGRLQ